MTIKDFSFYNKYVHVSSDYLDFSKKGIYLIKGKNGVGKTSIIRKIIFEINNNVSMNTIEQQKAYDRDRSGLFAYVPQNVPIPQGIKVLEYLTKNNENIDRDQMSRYLDIFNLEGLNMENNVDSLSGGEQIKLYIVSAILKNTPYIILDEPTNNLDDISAKNLSDVINSLSSDCTLIIISHDNRLRLKDPVELMVTETTIQTVSDTLLYEDNNKLPNNRLKRNNLKIGLSLQRSLSNILIHLTIFVFFVLVFLFNHQQFRSGKYSPKEYVRQTDYIHIYDSSDVCDEVNYWFADGIWGMSIPDSEFYNYITYEDIPKIAGRDDVIAVWIEDKEKTIKYMNDSSEKTSVLNVINTDDIRTQSVPYVLYEDHWEQTNIQDEFALSEGRAPKDDADEICLSKTLLSLLGVPDDLGTIVSFFGKEYVLVGITIYDIAWVSYSDNEPQNSLYYRYDDKTYQEFRNANECYQGYYFFSVDNILIKTKEGMEKKVLCDLVREYPGNLYWSYEFEKASGIGYNTPFFIKLILLNLLMSVVASVLWILSTRYSVAEDYRKIIDYQNYYLDYSVLKKLYVLFYILLTTLLCIFEEAVFFVFLEKEYLLCLGMTAIAMMPVIFVQLIVLWKRINPSQPDY